MGATFVFTDETGFLMAPLLRTSLAARGHTPQLLERASRRDKVSVVGALWKTPKREQVRLHYQTYPNQYVDNERYSLFLEDLLRERLQGMPVVVLHDGGSMHKGEPLGALADDVPWLRAFERLPPYAPELNPVEELWNYLKYDQLPNFAPSDLPQLEGRVNHELHSLHHDQIRLRTLLANSPLRW